MSKALEICYANDAELDGASRSMFQLYIVVDPVFVLSTAFRAQVNQVGRPGVMVEL